MVEIASENGRISNFQGLMTLTLTLDRVILHNIMHHSSTSNCMPNFIKIEETFCGRMDIHLTLALLYRLWGVNLKKYENAHRTQCAPASCGTRHVWHKTHCQCLARASLSNADHVAAWQCKWPAHRLNRSWRSPVLHPYHVHYVV